jgi:hypothetical protein
MDSARFDTLARTLSGDATRRGITRLLGGLALSVLLHPLAGAAKKRGHGKNGGKGKGKLGQHGKKGNDRTVRASAAPGGCPLPGAVCSGKSKCCSGKCSQGICPCSAASPCPSLDPPNPCKMPACSGGSCTTAPAPEDTPCGGGRVCQGGTCSCPVDTRDCGAACAACCGNADCPSNEVCQGGTCGMTTPSCLTDADCDNGNACTTGSRCDSQGACVLGTTLTCDDNIPCTRDSCDPATGCVHTPDDTLCIGDQVCQDGRCICPEGTPDCCPEWAPDCNHDGNCQDLSSDQHCGSCFNQCTDGRLCRDDGYAGWSCLFECTGICHG